MLNWVIAISDSETWLMISWVSFSPLEYECPTLIMLLLESNHHHAYPIIVSLDWVAFFSQFFSVLTFQKILVFFSYTSTFVSLSTFNQQVNNWVFFFLIYK